VDAPEVRYLERDGAVVAYQVVGAGGADVFVLGEMSQHFDLAWTDPHIHELYERGATFSRTVYMQIRGFGLSERIRYVPTLEQQADDVLAVMDTVGMRQVTLVGAINACTALALVAAKAPGRVAGIVALKPIACGPLAVEAAAYGWTRKAADAYASAWRHVFDTWGSGATMAAWDPVADTPYNRRLTAMLERCSATPTAAMAYFENVVRLNAAALLSAVQAPVRVLYSPTGLEPKSVVHKVADLLPDATFHELAPTLPGAAGGEIWLATWDHVEEMATGAPHSANAMRFLGTVLFTDVVASTELLARIGDANYRDLRAAHERQVRLLVEESGGELVKVTGDGTFSVFTGPSSAVRCAHAICAAARALGVRVRAGVHTGEMERVPGDLSGLSVHIGARIRELAEPDEVLVSSTVRDLVSGSGLAFVDRGMHRLKGVPGVWSVCALTVAAERPTLLPDERSMATTLDRAALQTARTAPGLVRAGLRVGHAMQRRRARARMP
jgi:class 3 adenylate cyclase/pimeloyl-ACP methyl ester carboxylesterase